MSGHSKWSTIKRKKGALDQKRGKIFTRCIHEITVAVKEGGGGDPAANARLRLAVDKARSVNMPADNIARAIRRATGEEKGGETFEIRYEGYGPGGVAVLVEAVTDNKNRTVSAVRHAFSRNGGSLGEAGTVAWMFEKKGVFTVDRSRISEEALIDLALGAGADDVRADGELFEVVCEPERFVAVKQALETAVAPETAEVQLVPKTRVLVTTDEAEQVNRLLEALDDLDDVMNVYAAYDVRS